MSGICTGNPIALVRAGRGLDIDTYADELDCVLKLINSGALGRGIDPRSIGWGNEHHKAAVQRVIAHCADVIGAIAEQDEKDRAYEAKKGAAS